MRYKALRVYIDGYRILLEYEYTIFGFVRRSTKTLARLSFMDDDDLFAIFPDGFSEQLKSLKDYYHEIYLGWK